MATRRDRAHHQRSPVLENLEGRFLLTIFGSNSSQSYYRQTARVRHRYQEYVGFLQKIELHSKATTAEYLALRDDTLNISQAAATTKLSQDAADRKAAAASVIIDRAFLDGFLDESGWQDIKSRLETTLDGLNVPQDVIDQTIVDMKAAAQSVGLTGAAYSDLAHKDQQLRQAEVYLPAGYGHYDDPQLFYTQHLRGFIRGGAVEKTNARNTLNADIHAIATPPQSASALAVLNRDVKALEQIGSRISTDANAQVDQAYLAAFANGSPDAATQAQLKLSLQQAVGVTAQPKTSWKAINQLVVDSPAFYAASGASIDKIETLLHDVNAYLAAGGSAPLNPFRVQVVLKPKAS